MKKYQHLIEDSYDDIIEVLDTLTRGHEEDNDFKISDADLRNLYMVSGAIQIIDEHYSFEHLSFNISLSFADLFITYATCTPEDYMSYEHKLRFFDLAREIKDNVHFHIKKQTMFD